MAAIRDALGKFRNTRFRVRVAEDRDLRAISTLDVNEFHGSSVDIDGLQDWFQTYNRGAFVLEEQFEDRSKQIVGAFGLWPITQEAYTQLVAGQLDERDIKGQSIEHEEGPKERRATKRRSAPSNGRVSHICHLKKKPGFKYWYVADIILDKKYRTKGLGKNSLALLLLREGLDHWRKFHDFSDYIELCSLATSQEGMSLLEGFGFKAARTPQGEVIKSQSGDTVYTKLSSPEQRVASIEQVEKLFKRSSRHQLFRAVGAWLFVAVIATAVIYIVNHPMIAKGVGTQLKQGWNLQIIAVFVLGSAVWLISNKVIRQVIIGACLIPIILKFLGLV